MLISEKNILINDKVFDKRTPPYILSLFNMEEMFLYKNRNFFILLRTLDKKAIFGLQKSPIFNLIFESKNIFLNSKLLKFEFPFEAEIAAKIKDEVIKTINNKIIMPKNFSIKSANKKFVISYWLPLVSENYWEQVDLEHEIYKFEKFLSKELMYIKNKLEQIYNRFEEKLKSKINVVEFV